MHLKGLVDPERELGSLYKRMEDTVVYLASVLRKTIVRNYGTKVPEAVRRQNKEKIDGKLEGKATRKTAHAPMVSCASRGQDCTWITQAGRECIHSLDLVGAPATPPGERRAFSFYSSFAFSRFPRFITHSHGDASEDNSHMWQRYIAWMGRTNGVETKNGVFRAPCHYTAHWRKKMSLAAYKAVMSFTGTQPGEISVKRLAIVLASFDPANVTDPKARVEVITFQKPRQEGCIPRSCLLALPEATSAHYVEQYLATLSDSEDGPPSASPVAAPTTPVAVTTSAAASSLAAAAATAPPAAVSAPAPAAVSPAPAPAESPAPAADPAEAMKHLFVALADDGTPTLKPTVAYLEAGGKVDLIPVVGGLYRHLPGPSLQRKAHPGDPDIIDPYHVLGAGAFGISFKMGDTRVGQRDVALKATAAPRTALARFMINNESYIPAAVRHPNVLSAAGPPMEVQLEPGGPLLRCLVTPFCEGGDLDRVIRRHQRNPSADPAADRTERWWLLVDMVRGLAYLHGRPFADNDRLVLHNDIKPANVLLRHDPATGRLVALLADLGMACEYTGGTVNLTPLIRGTPGFLAPELDPTAAARLADAGMRPGNTPATDVYAMGVTLYCLYSQTDTVHVTECPTEDDLRAAFAEVGALEAAAGCRPTLVELLVRMCSENPTARPAMGRILEAVEAVAGPMESVLLAAAREAHRLAEEAAAVEEARRKAAAVEETRRKAAADAEARRLAAAEEEARRKAAEEVRRPAAAEEARRQAEEARRKAAVEEEARHIAASQEVERRILAEEARRIALAEEDADRHAAAAEVAHRKAEEEAHRARAEEERKARTLERSLSDRERESLDAARSCGGDYLNLAGNTIGPVGAAALADALERDTTLRELFLGFNRIGPDGGRALAAMLQRNNTLEKAGVRLPLASFLVPFCLPMMFFQLFLENTGICDATHFGRALFHNHTLRWPCLHNHWHILQEPYCLLTRPP
ncbi:hypothetical protein PAPYR_4606 [Paratrimastix pyriformis]|uniref:Protein kinase domain-containing protein n=1 Tax=Paratrimastix pyriformis TaxID=342808 RepID=A0ABQ8UMT7_9EUKA|nr:hypothetical protein PAPYR_4606 [Paratrimastix pyriformis]